MCKASLELTVDGLGNGNTGDSPRGLKKTDAMGRLFKISIMNE
jgi:hypothetical protein